MLLKQTVNHKITKYITNAYFRKMYNMVQKCLKISVVRYKGTSYRPTSLVLINI